MFRYRYWIHKKDDKGRPLDESIVKAAEEIAPALARYRQREIRCESMTNSMLQSAVEAASKANRGRPIDNPIAYITSIYKHIVDRTLNRKRRFVPVGEDILEELMSDREHISFEEMMHNRFLLEKLLQAMDEETRLLCDLRLRGYSIKEIAKERGVKPNTLTAQYKRGLKRATEKVFEANESEDHGE
jgi:RNA polymerase sigma factor (sigma-70 family)